MVLTEILLIFNYTVESSLCSMPEKVRQNLNICLFWGVKTTSPSQPSRDAALSFILLQKGGGPSREQGLRVYDMYQSTTNYESS